MEHTFFRPHDSSACFNAAVTFYWKNMGRNQFIHLIASQRKHSVIWIVSF